MLLQPRAYDAIFPALIIFASVMPLPIWADDTCAKLPASETCGCKALKEIPGSCKRLIEEADKWDRPLTWDDLFQTAYLVPQSAPYVPAVPPGINSLKALDPILVPPGSPASIDRSRLSLTTCENKLPLYAYNYSAAWTQPPGCLVCPNSTTWLRTAFVCGPLPPLPSTQQFNHFQNDKWQPLVTSVLTPQGQQTAFGISKLESVDHVNAIYCLTKFHRSKSHCELAEMQQQLESQLKNEVETFNHKLEELAHEVTLLRQQQQSGPQDH